MLLMFEVEKAHWFYTDFWRERDSSLPSLSLRDFALKMFSHTAFLRAYVNRFETIYTKWQEYKRGVPTFGAIILNTNLMKVLMVQGYGSKSWGWPKGKLNKDESDVVCAAREVYEEIGFDVAPYIEEENAVVAKLSGQHMKLFIIPGIPEDTVFETLTRQEIKDIKWHLISDLQAKVKDETKKNKYYSVSPVLGRLTSWIRDYKRSLSRSRTPQRGTVSAAPSVTASPAAPKREKGEKKGKKGGYCLVQQEIDAAGVARDNADTFGYSGATFKETAAKGFSADEMFKVNAEMFNVHSTYSFDQYTTALPGRKERSNEEKGVHAPERWRPCQVQDAQTKLLDGDSMAGVEEQATRGSQIPENGKENQQPKSRGARNEKQGQRQNQAISKGSKGSALLGFTFDEKAIMGAMGF
jgi:mRNA-decapping enzyme subunit 2